SVICFARYEGAPRAQRKSASSCRMIPVSEGFTRNSTVSDVGCQISHVRNPSLGIWQSLDSVNANEPRAMIRDRCFGKGKEKARMLKTLADPAGDASCWAAEL